MNSSMGITPLTGDQVVLSALHRNISVGRDLTGGDKILAASAAATGDRSAYGPVPRDAQPIDIPLPETVKGAIFSARA